MKKDTGKTTNGFIGQLNNNKSFRIKIIAISIITLLLISGISAVIFLNKEEPEEKIVDTSFEIDDQISPLVNQGLILEVLRIRHRGLRETLQTRGNAWKTAPTFYFISNMDGNEFLSKNVAQHTETTEVFFNTWDSMFQENKIVKDSDEEQETSIVTLQIVEVESSGILGIKTTDVIKDEFTVTYDYRTGRWNGDDYFGDYDGYGYYLGETFEIWFNLYQLDYDQDYIPYWTEVNVLGTDPTVDDSKLDPDNDGIPTSWEWKWGYNPFIWDDHLNLDPDVDGLENLEEYKMEAYFADPYTQNVYIEVDFMEQGGIFDPPHTLPTECQQVIIEEFSKHNIKMIYDDGWPDGPGNGGGELVAHYEQISQDSGAIAQYYYHHFPEDRRGIFRYMVIGHAGGFNHPGIGNIYDTTFIPDYINKYTPFTAIKYFITRGVRPSERGQHIALAAVTMHELGHSCGLSNVDFEGIDNMTHKSWLFPTDEWKNTYIDYRSVMCYYAMYDPSVLSYSDGSNGPPYDQNDWEQFFLPTFQYNNKYVEEAGLYSIPDIIESEERFPKGYEFNQNLTDIFNQTINDESPVDPIQVEWAVYSKETGYENNEAKDIKVFVKPIVHASKWVLSTEGDLSPDNQMEFYGKEDIYKQVIEFIEEENLDITLIK
ncbi:hypothetical protein B6U98_01500 [Thermoplasmatales archaeon ex4572_165]|nr:MAG: hypothetical protein B6U98_01500 [Thermoplasmatales archaeon ex4572_165]RLF59143.1 MAG: hypothetical protein DRN27_03490 [Thermoplasmata archaeon]